jgi:hypothetical protein
LARTKAEMLAEIGASAKALDGCLHSARDPGFVTLAETRLVLRGRKRDDVLPSLSRALFERFPAVPREHLSCELLDLLKKAMGNAYKWGNREDPARSITVEVVATCSGVVVSVSDEGEGFDVERVVDDLRRDRDYFTHGGSGFAHFERARSVVSYADSGRTVLIRFLADEHLGRQLSAADRSALGLAGDEQYMKYQLAAACPTLRDQDATILSLRIYPLSVKHGNQAEIVYVVRYRAGESSETRTVTLAGRLLPEAMAEADITVTGQLREGQALLSSGLQVPKPSAVLKEPSMAIFECEPSKTLRDRAKRLSGRRQWVRAVAAVAAGLFAMHGSRIDVQEESLGEALENRRTAMHRAVQRLAASSPRRAERLHEAWARFAEQAGRVKACEPATIHGDPGWNNILCSEGRMQLFRFEQCRRSHPGFDVGALLADSVRYHLIGKKRDPALYAACREAIMKSYFARGDQPWRDQVDFFIASALFTRLERLLKRPEEKWQRKVDELLEQIASHLRAPPTG